MNYGYEKILRVQKACGVSFEEADKALKRTKGNEEQARLYALRNKKKKDGAIVRTTMSLMNLINYRVKVVRNKKVYIDLALGIVLLIYFLLLLFFYDGNIFFVTVVVFLIIVLSGSSLHLQPKQNKDEAVELIRTSPMDEDTVLEAYSDEEVTEDKDGLHTIEIE